MLSVLDIDIRSQALYDITMAIEIKEVKSEAFYKLAECHFQRGILAIQVVMLFRTYNVLISGSRNKEKIVKV